MKQHKITIFKTKEVQIEICVEQGDLHTCMFLSLSWDTNKMAGKGNSNDENLWRLENGNKDDHKEEGSRGWECGNVGGRDSCRGTSEDLMPLHIEVSGSDASKARSEADGQTPEHVQIAGGCWALSSLANHERLVCRNPTREVLTRSCRTEGRGL